MSRAGLSATVADRLHFFRAAEREEAARLLATAADRLGERVSPAERDRLLLLAVQVSSGYLGTLAATLGEWAHDPEPGLARLADVRPFDYLNWRPPLRLDFPQPLGGMIDACETKCVTHCCGLDAYDVTAANLIGWAESKGAIGLQHCVAALTQLEAELSAVTNHPGPVVGHDMLLDHEWPTAADCLAYFDDWRTEASRALAEVGGQAVLRPEWLTADVRGLVAGVVAARDFSRLPVLADALEDTGCDSRPVLDHLRAGGRHGWFCWVTDLLAGG